MVSRFHVSKLHYKENSMTYPLNVLMSDIASITDSSFVYEIQDFHLHNAIHYGATSFTLKFL